MKVAGLVALITGGASGLGAATADVLAAAGAHLVLADMNDDLGAEKVRSLRESYPGQSFVFCHCNVTEEADVKAAVEEGFSLGELRILVNCAGVGHAMRTVSHKRGAMDLKSFRRTIDINLVGTFNVIRLGAQAMVDRKLPLWNDEERGVIINVASVAAFDGQVGQAAYSASKGAVAAMTLPVARDLSIYCVRCVTVAPGTFYTPMTEIMPDKLRQGLEGDVPHPSRMGIPEEFGRLALHICENAYLNGETIRIDGAIRMPPVSSAAPKPPKPRL